MPAFLEYEERIDRSTPQTPPTCEYNNADRRAESSGIPSVLKRGDTRLKPVRSMGQLLSSLGQFLHCHRLFPSSSCSLLCSNSIVSRDARYFFDRLYQFRSADRLLSCEAGNLLHLVGTALYVLHNLLKCMTRRMNYVFTLSGTGVGIRHRFENLKAAQIDVVGQLRNLAGQLARLLGKLSHFFCHDSKASPMFACSGGFNRCIQCKQLRLLRDGSDMTYRVINF